MKFEEISANFDKMLDQIEGYTKRQARFVSDVSHELRTPIAVIKRTSWFTETLGERRPTYS